MAHVDLTQLRILASDSFAGPRWVWQGVLPWEAIGSKAIARKPNLWLNQGM